MKHTKSEPAVSGARRVAALTPLAIGCIALLGSQKSQAADRQWIEAAEEMKKQALSWGDQAYGAVLVKEHQIIGYGPSRVVKNQDPEAHAEREAIKHALSSVGAQGVTGAILYSTSRPCKACEVAAANAGIQRMYFGPSAQDAGPPKSR